MSQQDFRIDFSTWRDRYHPAGSAEVEIRLFESFGEDLQAIEDAVHRLGPEVVWTLLEFDGEQSIIAGFSRTNTLGYFVTERPWNDSRLQITLN